MSKIIGIVGSRRRNTKKDYELVEAAFIKVYAKGDTIVSGGCPEGADNFAEEIAWTYNASITIHKAEWKVYGKSAGFKRNTYIAQDADILIACVAPDRKGGTEDTIKKYLKLGKTRLILVE
jgi:hypothetical protein